MLFFQVSLQEARALEFILRDFMQASGTMINNDKSNIFFLNALAPAQAFLTRNLAFTIQSFPWKYLRMPLILNLIRTSCWKYLLGRIQPR